MDLLTSSFHSDLDMNVNTDDDHPTDMYSENFVFPDNLIDLDCILAGRESFSTEGRDSVGIVQSFNIPVTPKKTLVPVQEIKLVDGSGRESLGMRRNEFINGRESLGILRNSFLEEGRNSLLRIFDINSSMNVGFQNNTNNFHTAFLYSDNVKMNMQNSEDVDEEKINCNVKSGVLNDTLYLERKIITTKMENGSIVDDLPEDLFSTPLPDLIDISFDELNGSTPKKHTEESILNRANIYSAEDTNNEQTHNALPNCSSNSNHSRSQHAKDLLNNLSTIIKNDEIENQSQVRRILQDLADVLLVRNSQCNINDDSGHSTIEENDADSPKYCSDENIRFVKESDLHPEKRFSRSICVSDSSKTIHIEGKSTNYSVTAGGKTLRQKSLEDLDAMKQANVKKLSMPNVKLTSKKNHADSIRKGPMKAIVPLSTMRRNSAIKPKESKTPNKKSSGSSYLKKSRSTPTIRNAIPVAHSTPEQKLKESVQYRDEKNTSLMNSQYNKSASSINNSMKRVEFVNRSTSNSEPNIRRSVHSTSQIPSIAAYIAAEESFNSHLIRRRRRRSVSDIKYTPNSSLIKSNSNNIAAVVVVGGEKIGQSPLGGRYSKGSIPDEKLLQSAAVVMRNPHNVQTIYKNRCSPLYGSSACRMDRLNKLYKSDSKVTVKVQETKTYSPNRNRNLLQYIKPTNLLDKIKK